MKYILLACRPRCGTHYLKTLIGTCDNACYIPEEPFHDRFLGQPGFWDRKTSPEQWIREQVPGDKQACVFVAHPGHLETDDRILPSVAGIITHSVILYRRDILAQFTSYMLADQHDDWPTHKNSPPTYGELKVDKTQFQAWYNDYIRASILRDIKRWPEAKLVAYEDIESRFRELAAWLELDPAPAEAYTAKKEKRHLWNVVKNYQEARTWASEMAMNEREIFND
jgi:hypothetical protein